MSTLTILSTTNETFTVLHVKGYVNVLITQRVSIFENLVIGRFSAVNGMAVWTYGAEEPQIEKVEYVNMRPTIAGSARGMFPSGPTFTLFRSCESEGDFVARRPSNDTGTRPVSMADVARAAGVSQQTVSRVANGLPNVNEQTRQRVQAAMQELGFRPSYAGRSLRDGRYHSVGLCINDVTKFGNLTMIDGIASAARERGCAITLVEMSKTEEFSLAEATRRMAALPVDGIIIGMSRMAPDFEAFDPLPGIGTVIVTMYAHPRVTTVDSDHYGCSLLLMDHLFELGHEQIRYIGGPSFSVDEQFRRAGWQDALERKHIKPQAPLEGDWSANSGYEAARYLAEHDRTLTAIYAANDQMANGAIAALRDSGFRVPEDVSVVGVDDSLDDFVAHNELTTVRFDLHQRGREVFEHAVPKAGASDRPVAIRIPGQLIVRHTTSAPRA